MEKTAKIFQNKAVRYKGIWYEITPKDYEPERQTYQIAWKLIKSSEDSKKVYRQWFLNEQENSKLLYPLFLQKDE